jgi:hypothetical protein
MWDPASNRLIKGFVEVYDNAAMQKIKYDPQGVQWPEPTYVDVFPDLREVNPKLWKSYLDVVNPQKKANRQTALDELDGKPKPKAKQDSNAGDWELFINKELRRGTPVRKISAKLYEKYKIKRSYEAIHQRKNKLFQTGG